MRSNYGVFLRQYEPRYWYYAVVELTFKMLLTGVLCLISPGTPLQLIVALCTCLCYAILILHQAPFVTRTADCLSTVCTMALAVTLAVGLLHIAKFRDSGGKEHEELLKEPDFILMVVNVLPIAVYVVNLVLHAYGGKFPRCRKSGQRELMVSTTSVTPVSQTVEEVNATGFWQGEKRRGKE